MEFCDSAPGVSPEHLLRLFDRFYRVEASRNRASGGAGLGLAISRRIVEAHHGEISAHASVLGGLCIAMRFALLAADAAGLAVPSNDSSPCSKGVRPHSA